ncbi:MAG: nitroreductase family protein, partial [Ignavibacteriales bacterium CG_4_9_14_3_um_filter_30_11]
TAPSGANMQPWKFVVITNKSIKKEIRIGAEKEENIFYTKRASKEWLEALALLGTDEKKPFLEEAPCLIAIFSKKIDILPNGKKVKQYYSQESVGIATGFLITALHNAGLASLAHTPSPMRFLNKILNRPENEKPFLLLVVGYPSKDAEVPNINKKPLEEIAKFMK